MRTILLFLFLLPAFFCQAQNAPKTKVLVIGVFHFDYPDLDVHKTDKDLRFDILDPAQQKQLERMLNAIARFKPTHIAIERDPSRQHITDSVYQLYRDGHYNLQRSEIDQIGFRLGKMMGISKINCVDAQGRFYDYLNDIFSDSLRNAALEQYYFHNADSAITKDFNRLYRQEDSLRLSEGLILSLKHLNDPSHIKKMEGAYLTGLFKYSLPDQPYAGADFETCRWYNRNLRIFRNIQQMTNKPEDRILLIIGAGHLGVLYHLLECSPEYEWTQFNKIVK